MLQNKNILLCYIKVNLYFRLIYNFTTIIMINNINSIRLIYVYMYIYNCI